MKKIILLLFVCSTSFAQKFYLSPELYASYVDYVGKKDFKNIYDIEDNQDRAFNLELGVKFFEITYNKNKNFGMQFGLNYRKGNTTFNTNNPDIDYRGNTNIDFNSYRLIVYPFSHSKLAKQGEDEYIKEETAEEIYKLLFGLLVKGLHFDFGIAPANISLDYTKQSEGHLKPYTSNEKVMMKVFGWGFKSKIYTHDNEKLNIMFMYEKTGYSWDDIKPNNSNNNFKISGDYIGIGLVYDIQ